MAGTEGSIRDRAFAALARWGTEAPLKVLGAVLLVVFAFGAVLPGLSVSTSRTNMVSDEDPQQQRMNAFYERFGRPDYPLFVISGGTAEQRRAVVDGISTRLNDEPSLNGRVFGRVQPKDIASIVLVQDPTALAQLTAALPPGVDGPAFLEAGLVGWLEGLAAQVEAGLDGADEAAAGQDPEQAAEGLDQLAQMAGVLEDVVAGKDLLERFEGQLGQGQQGIDARGYLVTADGEHNLLAVYADVQSDEGKELQPLVEQLRAARDEALAEAPDGVQARLTGLPALAVDELAIVEQGLLVTSIAAAIGIFGLCLLLFRSLRQTIVALVPLVPGIVATLAVVRILYDDLNIITSGFVAVLLGLGIDFSVHVIARRNEEVREGRSPKEAIIASLRRTGPGIFTGAVVTSAAFLTNMTTEFTAFGELGVVTSAGLILMVLITFAIIPPLLVIGQKENAAIRVAPEPPGLASIPGVVRRGKAVVLGLAVVVAAAGAFTIRALDYNPRYFDFLPDSTESAQGLGVLEYDALASPVFAAFAAEDIEAARAKAAALRSLGSVAGVQTPSDLLPPLSDEGLAALRAGLAGLGRAPDFDALAAKPIEAKTASKAAKEIADLLEEVRFAMRGASLDTASVDRAQEAFSALSKTLAELDDAGLARLAAINADAAAILGPAYATAAAVAERGGYGPEDLPPLFATRFVSKDGKAVALFAVPSGQFWEEDVALGFAADVRTVDEDAIGLAMVHVEHGRLVREGFLRAAVYAAGIIVLLLLLDFRSLKDALLALLPTVIGWLWMLALMPLLGLNFNVANIVALPLVLGIGIAFGVHMMHRLREDDANGRRPSLQLVVRGTGGAIAVAATTTMVGFAALMLSAYGGMVSLGATMVLGIAACLLATLFVLPAVLLMLGRAE
ncbi:MAG: MMPL family transporter [Myxococcota bacterium]